MEFFDFDRKDFSNARVAAVRGARALAGGLLRTWRLRKQGLVEALIHDKRCDTSA
jgi:hypothetical protein